jgi:hypothetical protein
MTEKLSYRQQAVIENGKWIDGVLLTGTTVAAIAVVTKLVGATDFEFESFKISVDYMWVVFAVFTVIHFYTAWLFNRAIFDLWKTQSEEECLVAFQEITTTGGFFVRGLMPRIRYTKTIFGIRIYKMRLDDPSTWATHTLALLLIAAIIPFDMTNIQWFLNMVFLSMVIGIINWLIGSEWILSLSELSIPHEKSVILTNRQSGLQASPPENVKGIQFLLTGLMGMVISVSGFLLSLFHASLYAFLIWIGGSFALKTLTAIIAVLIVPRIIKKSLQIKRFGKVVFVVLFVLLSAGIIAIYLTWI